MPSSGLFSSFFFDPVTPQANKKQREILSLPINKAHGLYSFPAKIFKYGSSVLSKPLAIIMNLSIQKGIYYPLKLKHAKVVPVYKDGDELDPGNYRPISSLSDINKIFKNWYVVELIILSSSVKFWAVHSSMSSASTTPQNMHC